MKGLLNISTVWLYFLEEDSFLDLVKALEFNLHKDCQMERAVISAPSLNSPKTGTWTKVAFDSITSKGEKKSSNPKTNGLFPVFIGIKHTNGMLVTRSRLC